MKQRWSEIDEVDLAALEAEMQGELHDLREAATVYAQRSWARHAAAVPAGVGSHANTAWRWAAAGVAAAVLAVGGTRLAHRSVAPADRSETALRETQGVTAVSDEALLYQIQSDLSSGVPAAMEPLQTSSNRQNSTNTVQR